MSFKFYSYPNKNIESSQNSYFMHEYRTLSLFITTSQIWSNLQHVLQKLWHHHLEVAFVRLTIIFKNTNVGVTCFFLETRECSLCDCSMIDTTLARNYNSHVHSWRLHSAVEAAGCASSKSKILRFSFGLKTFILFVKWLSSHL